MYDLYSFQCNFLLFKSSIMQTKHKAYLNQEYKFYCLLLTQMRDSENLEFNRRMIIKFIKCLESLPPTYFKFHKYKGIELILILYPIEDNTFGLIRLKKNIEGIVDIPPIVITSHGYISFLDDMKNNGDRFVVKIEEFIKFLETPHRILHCYFASPHKF